MERCIAYELCSCSVADLFYKDKETIEFLDKNKDAILKNPRKWILRQSAEAVSYLHSLKIIHRNTTPNNFMIVQVSPGKYVVKLADFVKSKSWQNADGSASENSRTSAKDGWISPEINDEDLSLLSDTFILGCYFHFVLSDGKHPFGNSHVRWSNIIQNKLLRLTVTGDAKLLIEEMIERDLTKRLTMEQVLEHKYFSEGNECYDLYGNGNVRAGLCIIFNNKNFINRKVQLLRIEIVTLMMIIIYSFFNW